MSLGEGARRHADADAVAAGALGVVHRDVGGHETDCRIPVSGSVIVIPLVVMRKASSHCLSNSSAVRSAAGAGRDRLVAPVECMVRPRAGTRGQVIGASAWCLSA